MYHRAAVQDFLEALPPLTARYRLRQFQNAP